MYNENVCNYDNHKDPNMLQYVSKMTEKSTYLGHQLSLLLYNFISSIFNLLMLPFSYLLLPITLQLI